ncbi:MAG: glycosyltransferase family 2 protein [Candidatus Binatia bacterium]
MTKSKPVLSVIITTVGGKTFLQKCLSRLVPQTEGRDIEVIVPYDSTAREIADLQNVFPQVLFVDMGFVKAEGRPGTQQAAHEMFDRRTAAGLNAARGEILALLQDYGSPDPSWCDQLLEAHRLPYSVIGGAVEHGGKEPLNWAVYFLDFGRYQLPLPEGPTDYLTDVNVSYKRAALESVRYLWAERYKEVTVNWTLTNKGVVLWQRPQIVVWQDRGTLSFTDLIVERFSWGRLFGCIRTREISPLTRLLYIVLSPGIPLILLARMARKVFSTRRNRGKFMLALPQFAAMTFFWCLGEFAGYLTGRESSR